MKVVASVAALAFLLFIDAGRAMDSKLENKVQALVSVHEWEKALNLLLEIPEGKRDKQAMEYLAMAYLYTSSQVDLSANYEKAKSTYEQVLKADGRARFLVARGHDRQKETHLLEAYPGQLVVDKSQVQWVPLEGGEGESVSLDRSTLQCGANDRYGKGSNAFHLKSGKTEYDFRPVHFSAEEVQLICSLAGGGGQSPSNNSGKRK